MAEEERFTEKELAENDGADGARAYVAVDGKVYDVSGSDSWEGGEHYGEHYAGADLTDAMESAPHGMEVFDPFPAIGELE